MAETKKAVKLSEQWQDGQFKCFRKEIGKHRFYLTTDREESERLATVLAAIWSRLERAGSQWTPEVIEEAYSLAGIRKTDTRNGYQQAPVSVLKPQAPYRSLYATTDSYLHAYKARVSASRYQRHVISLNAYKAYQADCAMEQIGAEQITGAVSHFMARPQTGYGLPMAVATVQTTVKAIRDFFDWCDLSELWQAPRRFERLFRVNYSKLATPLERKQEANGVEVFTVAELITLWQAATPRQRLYMGLALNTGETAQGIADLSPADFRNGDVRVIDRHRGKTGVRGVYALWSEVVELVEAEREASGDRLFLSGDGKPLVWYHATGRVDSISKTWANLLKKCPKVRKLGYKHLRKTGASLIEQIGGERVAEQYLSHKGQSVARKHYLANDYQQLGAALNRLHEMLLPMFATAQSQNLAKAS